MNSVNLHIADVIILLAYFLFIIWWAIKHAKSKNSSDYFLAGRNSSWIVVGLSLFAASVSSSTLMGHSGEGFISGIAVFNYNWVSILVMVFFAMFFLPFYLKSGIFTMPEFLEKRFDGRSRTYFSLVTIIGNVFLDASATLYTGALIIKMILPDADLMIIILGMAIVAGSYTIIGGLSSAINADLIQAVVLLVGSVLITFFAIAEIGGWAEFYQRFNEGVWLKLVRPLDDPTTPWLGVLFGIPILGFYFWGNNQVMVQRVLSARSIDHGRKGVLLVGFLYLLTLFIFIMPGLIGRGIDLFGVEGLPDQIISGSELKEGYGINTDQVYPRLIMRLLPVGVIGVILAAMISALTSTLSATLSSVSTLFTMDFYSRWNKNASSKHLVRVGQLTALMVLLIAVCWAPFIQKFDSLVSYYQELVSYLAPPVVATFFLGLFWKRSNEAGAFGGLLSGLAVAALIMLAKYVFQVEINMHFLIMAPMILVLSALANVLISLRTKAPANEKIEGTTWTRDFWREESLALKGTPWYRNFRIWSLILILSCLLLFLLHL